MWISGRVQGVFFRMETMRAAHRIGVKGWVKNMRDGRVEAVMEGPESKVDEMAAWCRKGPALANVTGMDIMEEAFEGACTDFEIVR